MTGIFLLKDNDQLIEMTNQEYESEDLLQELLAKYPNLLSGDQMDSESPRRWLLISRELSIPSEEGGGARWAVDHLFLDQDAIPTLVEVKRSSDTRLRREVVGQMLDYAANAVVYWPIESIVTKFETDCEKKGLDSNQVLLEFLGDEDQVQGFWEKVKTNLQAEKVRLVFVADEIPSELRRIVEFLNGQMDPVEVLAVEVKQYVGEGHKSLVPRVFGQTEEARQKKSSHIREYKLWDDKSFFENLHSRDLDKEVVAGIEALFQKSREFEQKGLISIFWGRGEKIGSFTLKGNGNSYISVYSDANISLNMGAWKGIGLANKKVLAEKLGSDLGFTMKYADNNYPYITKQIRSAPDGVKKFLDWLELAVQTK